MIEDGLSHICLYISWMLCIGFELYSTGPIVARASNDARPEVEICSCRLCAKVVQVELEVCNGLCRCRTIAGRCICLTYGHICASSPKKGQKDDGMKAHATGTNGRDVRTRLPNLFLGRLLYMPLPGISVGTGRLHIYRYILDPHRSSCRSGLRL